jgi:hypothetical protein
MGGEGMNSNFRDTTRRNFLGMGLGGAAAPIEFGFMDLNVGEALGTLGV